MNTDQLYINGENFQQSKIDFKKINRIAIYRVTEILQMFLPSGKRIGNEWVSINPTRNDSRVGSFKINMTTGKWADFATEDRGGDVISLVAYLCKIKQIEAAKKLAGILGVANE